MKVSEALSGALWSLSERCSQAPPKFANKLTGRFFAESRSSQECSNSAVRNAGRQLGKLHVSLFGFWNLLRRRHAGSHPERSCTHVTNTGPSKQPLRVSTRTPLTCPSLHPGRRELTTHALRDEKGRQKPAQDVSFSHENSSVVSVSSPVSSRLSLVEGGNGVPRVSPPRAPSELPPHSTLFAT